MEETPQQKWRAKNREKVRADQKAWRDKNKEKMKGLARKYYLQMKEKGLTQAYYREREYGVSEELYQELLQKQEGKCALCKTKEATQLDHDHFTEQVRGLLCATCNRSLAGVDNLEWLDRALDYLEGAGEFEHLISWRARVVIRN